MTEKEKKALSHIRSYFYTWKDIVSEKLHPNFPLSRDLIDEEDFANQQTYHTLEKALNERDDNKRILEIIKKKKVNIQWLITDTLNSYNNRVKHYYPFDMQTLTETEFNLIKEWLTNE